MVSKMNQTQIRVTQTRSGIRHTQKQKDTLRALGLGRIGRSVDHTVTPSLMGMLKAVSHLIEVDYSNESK